MPYPFLARLRAAAAIALGRRPDPALVADLFPSQRSSPPPRGTSDFLNAYSSMPWLRATVHRVAVGVASAEWSTYAVKRQGKFVRHAPVQRAGHKHRKVLLRKLTKAGELVEIEEHPLLDLLHNPNPFMTGGGFRRLTAMYVDLVGEGFWMIERDGLGVPARLWPLPPHWVRDVPSPRRPVFNLTLPYGGWQGDVPMTEIVWFVDPDPFQPYGRGAGTARSLADELETDEYAAKHTKAWFYNSARPDLIVTVEGARDPDLRKAEQTWLDRHQGFFRAFKPFFVNRKITVDEIGQTFRDMQFTQLREHERDTIIQVFGVPPEILGVLQNSNRATIDAADYLFARHVLVPRLDLIRETIQERLAPMFDERLIIDYESPVQEDRQVQLEAAKAQPAAIKIDEWRELAGFEELEDGTGDAFIAPMGIQVVDTLDELAPLPALAPGVPDPNLPVDPNAPDPANPDDPQDPGDEGGGEGGGGQEGDDGKARLGRRSGWMLVASAADDFRTMVHRVAEAMEPRWRRRFAILVERAKGRLDVAALEHAITSRSAREIEALVEAAGLARELGGQEGVRALALVTADAAARAGAGELATLGVDISWVSANPYAVAWAHRYSAQLVTEVSDRTRQAVRYIVERGFREGHAPREMAREIRDVIGLRADQAAAVARFREGLQASGLDAANVERRSANYAEAQLRGRATLIARTETIAAANMGQQLLWEQGVRQGSLSDQTARKIWITTPDDRLDAKVCEPMPEMAENQDLGVDDVFTTGDGRSVKAPPAHPGCRCAMGLKILRRALPMPRKALPAGTP